MIDRKKIELSVPSQEMEDYIRHIYDYAVGLYLNNNMSWQQIKNTLIEQGIQEPEAEAAVSNLRLQVKAAKNNLANKELGYGALWAIGGIILTAITNGKFIFYGAVLWGGWLILKGLYHKIAILLRI
jgi:hypothetical protein